MDFDLGFSLAGYPRHRSGAIGNGFPPITSIANRGSIQFSGSSNSLVSYGSTSGWTFGTSDLTIECWFWQLPGGSFARLFAVGNWPTTQIGISVETGSAYLWVNGANIAFTIPSLYGWHHLAVVRQSGVFNVYLDGTRLINDSSYTAVSLTADNLTIGNEPTPSASATFRGCITNFRIVKGTAVYSGASFSPPTSPLSEITNTQLLLTSRDVVNVLDDLCVFDRVPTASAGTTFRDSTPFI